MHTWDSSAHAVCPLIIYSTWTSALMNYKWLSIAVVFHTRGQRKLFLMHNITPTPTWPKAPENSRPVLQEQNSLKTETFLIIPPPVAAAYLLSITVNITEHEVEGWEEAKHKPAAQCTCLAAAWSDIWGHRDLVERADAHWCTGTGTWQLHKWLKLKKIGTNIW